MYTRADFKLYQPVYFGRGNGEQTLGKIIKLNPTKAKVEILEDRGNGRGSAPGSTWTVPYCFLRPADPNAKPGTPAPPPPTPPVEKLKYWPFGGVDNFILDAILCCHAGLSPENLSCDGEASLTHIRRTQSELNRKLRGLFIAFGRHVDESEVYEWDRQRRDYEKERQRKIDERRAAENGALNEKAS